MLQSVTKITFIGIFQKSMQNIFCYKIQNQHLLVEYVFNYLIEPRYFFSFNITFAGYLRSLSCWKLNLCPSFKSRADWNRFSYRIGLDFFLPSILPLTWPILKMMGRVSPFLGTVGPSWNRNRYIYTDIIWCFNCTQVDSILLID